MFEKVNPSHPDKVADRIAGAIVDIAYAKEENPKVAVEVLIGHGRCFIIIESSVTIDYIETIKAVHRIAGQDMTVKIIAAPQDEHLAENQAHGFRCGDNGIFKGTPITEEQKVLTAIAKDIYDKYPTDGKYLIDKNGVTVCQSNASYDDISKLWGDNGYKCWAIINPLGEWTGGPDVDAGATNRKLGSDMGDAVTGGGLHGKDLSKADVTLNIFAHIIAQEKGSLGVMGEWHAYCAW